MAALRPAQTHFHSTRGSQRFGVISPGPASQASDELPGTSIWTFNPYPLGSSSGAKLKAVSVRVQVAGEQLPELESAMMGLC